MILSGWVINFAFWVNFKLKDLANRVLPISPKTFTNKN